MDESRPAKRDAMKASSVLDAVTIARYSGRGERCRGEGGEKVRGLGLGLEEVLVDLVTAIKHVAYAFPKFQDDLPIPSPGCRMQVILIELLRVKLKDSSLPPKQTLKNSHHSNPLRPQPPTPPTPSSPFPPSPSPQLHK